MDVSQPKQQEQHVEDFKSAKLDDTESQARTHVLPEEELSESLKGRKKYKDVAAAALEAFESAAYAAQAARAAVELSRYDSQDIERDDHGDSSHGKGTLYDSDGSLTPELQGRYEASEENKQAARAAVELSRYDSQDIERDDHGDSSHGQGTLYDSDGSLTPELQGRYEASEENKQAARAAVELSRYDSQDIERDDHGDSSHGQGTLYDSDGSLTPELQGRYEASEENKQAARAADELSRYDSQDIEWDDHGDSSHGQGTLYDSDGSLTPELQGRYEASEENKLSNDSLVFNEIYTIDNISSESEDENMKGNRRVHLEFQESKTKPGFDRTPSNSSSDSDGNMWNERYQLSDSLPHNKPVGNEMVSYLVDKKAEREQVSIPSPKHHDLDLYRKTNLLADENQHIREYNAVLDEDVSFEDENNLPYQSPKWIPLKSHADAMINPKKGNYEYKTAHSTTSAEN
jgi:vacuolar protein sorting-associated protein IST1